MPLISHDQIQDYQERIVVAGGRNYNNYPEFCVLLARYLRMMGKRNFVLISGRAPKGPDDMVIRYAREKDLPWAEFPADWENLDAPGAVIRARKSDGKRYNVNAGFARNLQMRDPCTRLLAFWDGESKGTAHMIESCMERPEIRVFAFIIKPDDVVRSTWK